MNTNIPPHRMRFSGAIANTLMIVLFLISGVATFAADDKPPKGISYQGYLTDSSGDPLAKPTTDGGPGPTNYKIRFRIYPAEEGGTAIWAEEQTVTVDNGAFSVLLGEGDAISGESALKIDIDQVFDDTDASDRYVEITVIESGQTSGTAIAPRLRLVTSPYAFLASKAIMADKLSTGSTDLITYSSSSDDVTIAKNLKLGVLTASDDSTFEGTLGVQETLGVEGKATLAGGLQIANNVDASLTSYMLRIGRDSDAALHLDHNEVQAVTSGGAASTLHANIEGGDVELSKAGNKVSVNSDLVVDENTKLIGNVGIGTNADDSDALKVSGNSTLNGTLDVSGAVKLAASLEIDGGATEEFVVIKSVGTTGTTVGELRLDQNEIQAVDTSGSTAVGAPLYLNNDYDAPVVLTGGTYLGIGTPSPTAPLDIATTGTANYNRKVLLRTSSPYVDDRSESTKDHSSVSIYTVGTIVGPLFHVYSDIRIKEIVDSPPGEASLDTIMKLKVTDYRMRDWIAHGKSVRRGLIAQEVEKVFPEAVSRNRRFVPDIYALAKAFNHDAATKTLRIETSSDHGLKVDDVVRVISDDTAVECRVTAVADATRFTLGNWERPVKDLFLYGKRVDDFRTVDYDQVFSTGIAAIQEVNRKLEASNQELRSSLTAVTEENARLSQELSSVMQRLQTLESLVK